MRDNQGNTALHWACYRGEVEAAWALLGWGADMNFTNA